MGKIIVQNILILICLILVQVLICNHIMLFNIAMVFVFIYVVISLPLNLSTGWLLTWAFFSGLVVDIFSNTVGVNSLACTLLAIRSEIRHKPHFECEKTVVLTSDSVKDCSDGNAFWECRGISACDYCVAYLIFDMSRNFFYVCDRCIFTFPVQRPYERCVFKFYREVLGFVKQRDYPRHVGTGNVHDTYNSILVNDSHSSFNTVKTASVDSEEIFGQPRIVVYYGCGNIIVAVFGGEGCQCV